MGPHSKARGPRRVIPLLSVLPLPLSAAENREDILKTNARALPPDEPCSRSMHVKMHKRKQPVGCVAETGDRWDIPLTPFGNLQLDSGSAIPSWGGPLPIPITNLDRRRYAWPLRACLRGSLKPSLRPLLWQVALETWTSSSTLELGACCVSAHDNPVVL